MVSGTVWGWELEHQGSSPALLEAYWAPFSVPLWKEGAGKAPLSFSLYPCPSFSVPSSPLPGDCLLHAASLIFLTSLANVPSATAWAPGGAGPQPAHSPGRGLSIGGGLPWGWDHF